jgi:hypothetical protein
MAAESDQEKRLRYLERQYAEMLRALREIQERNRDIRQMAQLLGSR